MKWRPYCDELKKFHVTLCFYSPQGYLHLRKRLNLCLPHSRVLRGWYKSINRTTGFTDEASEHLKSKVKDFAGKGKTVLINLVMDEMKIQKMMDYDKNKFHRYINLGHGDVAASKQATDVLVLLTVSIQEIWKCPLAYFFVSGLSAADQQSIVSIALWKFHDIGVRPIQLQVCWYAVIPPDPLLD